MVGSGNNNGTFWAIWKELYLKIFDIKVTEPKALRILGPYSKQNKLDSNITDSFWDARLRQAEKLDVDNPKGKGKPITYLRAF